MFSIDRQKFGAFVAQLRKERGYTQKEVAQKLFLSDKTVSKWETGVSIPDTALLMPLAELLGVTVTELLMCQRVQAEEGLNSGQVEDVVKTALAYQEGGQSRAYHVKSWWPLAYILCGILGIGLALLGFQRSILSEAAQTGLILGLLFGAYFCFFAKTRLSSYYDQNACGFYHDGPFRMNVPGVRFTNSNWPHILRVGRIWSCAIVVVSPVMDLAGNYLLGARWPAVQLWVWLACLLVGLFLPMYIVGKRYE